MTINIFLCFLLTLLVPITSPVSPISMQHDHIFPGTHSLQRERAALFFDKEKIPEKASETLSWAVKLFAESALYPSEETDKLANEVAKGAGLRNLGQVGSLPGHYLFAHLSHGTNFQPRQNHIDSLTAASNRQALPRTNASQSLAPEYSNRIQKYLSRHNQEWQKVKLNVKQFLDVHPKVEWHTQQMARIRTKRGYNERKLSISRKYGSLIGDLKHIRKRSVYNPLNFNDPVFPKQWHLVNNEQSGKDINVTGIWLHNITGRGITTAVIDDGLQWENPDLLENYNAQGSFDLNSNDDDPSPSTSKSTNHHGTRCAGEIAAVANNDLCGVGVAFGSKVAGIRILDGPVTDATEAAAFTKKVAINDIYSCSWGPEDDGKTVDGPQHLAMEGMRHGVDYGRRGYGAIYVVASGNGGQKDDDCNYDGYANSIYTVTIGAVDEEGRMPYYSEECASMLAVTYSSGSYNPRRDIVTTDWTWNDGTGCTENHSGTSAAAPITAAMIALMLEARPCLTWRDVQYIIAVSAVKVDTDQVIWTRNSVGLYHSHQHGFGLLSAWRLVNTAKAWQSIPWLTVFRTEEMILNEEIPSANIPLLVNKTITRDNLEGYNLQTLEYVHITLTLTHERRGDIKIVLICPSGTPSVIGATRTHDNSTEGLEGWTFSTVRCWGEEPVGTWTLIITDIDKAVNASRGILVSWMLIIFGSSMTPADVQQKIQLVDDAASGKYLGAGYQLPCQAPLVTTKFVESISHRIMKILALSGIFILVLGLYQTYEYMFCYDEEKETSRIEALKRRMQELASLVSRNVLPGAERATMIASNHSGTQMVEYTQLSTAADDIEMQLDSDVIENCRTEETSFSEPDVISNNHTRISQAVFSEPDFDVDIESQPLLLNN